VVLELILAMPVLIIATLAVLEFGVIALVQQAIATAAIEGAREAARGSMPNEVAAVVDTFLAVHDFAGATAAMPDARVDVEVGPASSTVGDATIPCTPQGPAVLNANEARVTVCVRMSDNDRPVPDWLSYFGFTLAGKTYEISALAPVE
jgi:Flp pilus assembly protein TadG